MSIIWQTVRKFLHKNDGYLYTSGGTLIPIKATSISDDATVIGVKISDFEGMIYYSGGQ